MTAAILAAVCVWLGLQLAFRDRRLHADPERGTNLKLGIYVGQHVLARARQRIDKTLEPIDIARDIIEGLALGRHGTEVPRRANGTTRHIHGDDSEFVWNDPFDRIYIIRRTRNTITVITALPTGRRLQAEAPTILQAIRDALARYAA